MCTALISACQSKLATIQQNYFSCSIFLYFCHCLRTLQLDELNTDPNVHGIIVQMPLDCDEKIDSDLVTDYVSPEKDVDGLVTIERDHDHSDDDVVFHA